LQDRGFYVLAPENPQTAALARFGLGLGIIQRAPKVRVLV
jgi:hypothetical protein